MLITNTSKDVNIVCSFPFWICFSEKVSRMCATPSTASHGASLSASLSVEFSCWNFPFAFHSFNETKKKVFILNFLWSGALRRETFSIALKNYWKFLFQWKWKLKENCTKQLTNTNTNFSLFTVGFSFSWEGRKGSRKMRKFFTKERSFCHWIKGRRAGWNHIQWKLFVYSSELVCVCESSHH